MVAPMAARLSYESVEAKETDDLKYIGGTQLYILVYSDHVVSHPIRFDRQGS